MVCMSTKYAINLNFDNDAKVYRIPVNPETIKISVNGKTTASDIEKLGTVIHKGLRDVITVSWSSFFPSSYSSSYCACKKGEFKKPAKMHKWILKLMEAKDPLHLVVSGGVMGLNIYAVITKYTAQEDGGDPGTINYSIEMKEYRSVTIKQYSKTSDSKTGNNKSKKKKKETSKKRVSNKQTPKTYTIKNGDCLWNIAKKYYGNGSQYTKLLNANRSVLDAAAKKHGSGSCNNGNLIYAGTTITIP